IAENVESVLSLIEQARAASVHEVLGYRSWTEYVADKFGGTLTRIGKAERLPIVELLAEQGMSTRAIATVVGVSQPQVVRDRQVIHRVSPDGRAGVSDETPEVLSKRPLSPDEISGLVSSGLVKDLGDLEDCLAMADATPDEFDAAITEAEADDDLSRENVVAKITAIKKITGIDGKTYASRQAATRRPALAEQFRLPVHKLHSTTNQIKRLVEDDRLPANRDRVAATHAVWIMAVIHDLLHIADVLHLEQECGASGQVFPGSVLTDVQRMQRRLDEANAASPNVVAEGGW
ncbi:MAG: hypothetical protein ACR2LE_03250, partial [Nocardioidaceae bacterium]